MTKKMPFDYFNPQYRAARAEAFARSRGMCQVCRVRRAKEAHHWSMNYPAARDTRAEDLTALCKERHDEATRNRKQIATLSRLTGGGNVSVLPSEIEQYPLSSPRPGPRPSPIPRFLPGKSDTSKPPARPIRASRPDRAIWPSIEPPLGRGGYLPSFDAALGAFSFPCPIIPHGSAPATPIPCGQCAPVGGNALAE